MEKDGASAGQLMNETKRKCYPARSKRYSRAQEQEIFEHARSNDVQAAAQKFGTTGTSIYE